MTLADNNILSTFARIGRLQLLFDLFKPEPLGVTPAVFAGLQTGVERGAMFLEVVLQRIESGELHLVALTPEEVLSLGSLPASLGAGERESVAVCRARRYVLLTNDKRARNFSRGEGVTVLDLGGVLRALWECGLQSKQQVKRLIQEIETKEKLVIKNKGAIFKK